MMNENYILIGELAKAIWNRSVDDEYTKILLRVMNKIACDDPYFNVLMNVLNDYAAYERYFNRRRK